MRKWLTSSRISRNSVGQSPLDLARYRIVLDNGSAHIAQQVVLPANLRLVFMPTPAVCGWQADAKAPAVVLPGALTLKASPNCIST